MTCWPKPNNGCSIPTVRVAVRQSHMFFLMLRRPPRGLVTMPDPQKLAWPSATPEQLEQAERLVNQPRRLQYFFERLNNPLWLAPLAARGWFDTDRVPEPIVGDDGSVQILDWPPAAYLARVAAAVPETAVSLIDAVGGTTNPLVQRHLVAALLALPPTQAAEFASLAVSWMRGPHAAWLDERDLTSLTAALLRLDDTNTGERLALALLSSIRDEYVL